MTLGKILKTCTKTVSSPIPRGKYCLIFQVVGQLTVILYASLGGGLILNIYKNSCHFSEFVRGKTLKADQVLVSFDVVSLFTNIPVDLAIKVATKRLRQDATLL